MLFLHVRLPPSRIDASEKTGGARTPSASRAGRYPRYAAKLSLSAGSRPRSTFESGALLSIKRLSRRRVTDRTAQASASDPSDEVGGGRTDAMHREPTAALRS